jgi:multiple antibiotic resistance protein
MFESFDFQQMISAFIVLFAVIDIIGYYYQFERKG